MVGPNLGEAPAERGPVACFGRVKHTRGHSPLSTERKRAEATDTGPPTLRRKDGKGPPVPRHDFARSRRAPEVVLCFSAVPATSMTGPLRGRVLLPAVARPASAALRRRSSDSRALTCRQFCVWADA